MHRRAVLCWTLLWDQNMTVVEVKLPLEIHQWIASKVDRRIGDCEELCAVLAVGAFTNFKLSRNKNKE